MITMSTEKPRQTLENKTRRIEGAKYRTAVSVVTKGTAKVLTAQPNKDHKTIISPPCVSLRNPAGNCVVK